jgi:hypothetical protein
MIVIIVNVHNGGKIDRGGQMIYKLLRRQLPAVVTAEPATPRRFGVPQPCPECGRGTVLGRIDVRRRVQYQDCRRCDFLFGLHEDQFVEAQAS